MVGAVPALPAGARAASAVQGHPVDVAGLKAARGAPSALITETKAIRRGRLRRSNPHVSHPARDLSRDRHPGCWLARLICVPAWRAGRLATGTRAARARAA